MEQMTIAAGPDGKRFDLQRMQAVEIREAAALCDRNVGKNLYPAAYFQQVWDKPDHWFLFIRDPAGKTAGYVYFYLSTLDEVAHYVKLPREQVAALAPGGNPLLVHLRSIGIENDYRGQGLATRVMEWVLDYTGRNTAAQAMIIVCWKPRGGLQLKNTMEQLSFRHVADLPRFWYHVEDLYCPICKGRCRCDAAFYYKPLRGGTD